MNTAQTPTVTAVLLTGATGSLGGYLCRELLHTTAASVYCLIRAHDADGARRRLQQRLSELGTPHALDDPRLHAVPGDLSKPAFGLPASEFDALAQTVDTILHAAATVNLAADYDDLAPANLVTVHHVIALARRRAALTGLPPHLHHVSTLATLLHARTAGWDTVDENTPLSSATSGPQGYPRTKREAEAALRAAATTDGLPVTVYRPGAITGHSETGRTTATDPLAPLLTAVTALGAAPAGELWVPGQCVDAVARCITRLMPRPDPDTGVFHIIEPEPLRMDDLFQALRRAGHRLEDVPVESWWKLVEDHVHDPYIRPMAAMRDISQPMLPSTEQAAAPHIRCDATWQALTNAGVTPTSWTPQYFDRLIAAFSLPTPRARPAVRGHHAQSARTANQNAPLPSAEPPPVRIDGLAAPVCFAHNGHIPDPVAAAAACELAGYGGFWVQEQQHNPLLALARAADHTTLPLGTAAVVALARNPMTLAHATHDLQHLSRGQLILGIAPQLKANLLYRYSMPADQRLSRMREFIQALRHIWSSWNTGQPLEFRGRHYKHALDSPFFTPPPCPYGPPRVFLTATGPRMAELTGELADGLIAPPYAPPLLFTRVLLPALERGLEKAGRDRTDIEVVCPPLLVTGRNAAERQMTAKRARTLIAFFCGTRAYRSVFELYQLGRVSDAIAQIAVTSDPSSYRRMADLVDDDTLQTFATVAEDPQQMGAQLRARYGGSADRLLLPAPHSGDGDLWCPQTLGLSAADPQLSSP
ncbi:TIGR03617 family F420-dependent LLM class oxidoreductase [Embleya sp. NPDC127516]|uniref:TIGR03617 family F420-dependent LLM class oxidoreductase n=1 Tax=Embleya sp. NPDC127516 TaxID=3363990 RepID=UPI00381F3A3E